MLKGIPKVISPELLKTLSEMGHTDTLVLGDANFTGESFARQSGCRIIRADGIG
ncbi:MAG: fucose isomerase, partial [Clostridia bacterium]|nr:fucose isomerase [Clostridia bacterium]